MLMETRLKIRGYVRDMMDGKAFVLGSCSVCADLGNKLTNDFSFCLDITIWLCFAGSLLVYGRGHLLFK